MKITEEFKNLHGSWIQIADTRKGGNSSWGIKEGYSDSSIRLAWYNDGKFDPYSSAELSHWGLKELLIKAAEEDLFEQHDLAEMIGQLTASIYRQHREGKQELMISGSQKEFVFETPEDILNYLKKRLGNKIIRTIQDYSEIKPDHSYIYLFKNEKGGFSFRVYSKNSDIGVTLLYHSSGTDTIGFETKEHYDLYLQGRLEKVDYQEWLKFLHKNKININSKKEKKASDYSLGIIDHLAYLMKKLV